MTDDFRTPSLGISNIVYGRRNLTGQRVEYLLDNTDPNSPYQIPEQIVLKRWKAKDGSERGLRFSGFRLSPKLWQSLYFVFDGDLEQLCSLSEEQINDCFSEKYGSEEFKEKHLVKISGDKVKRLTAAIGHRKLRKILERHNDPNFPDRYGTPDLFLYAVNI